MRTVGAWWHARSQAERFDALTRWPLFVLSGSEPLSALVVAGGQVRTRPAGVALLLVVVAAHTAACLGLLHAGIKRRLGGPRPGRRLVVTVTTLTVVGPFAGLAAFPAAWPLTAAGTAGQGSDGIPVLFALGLVFYLSVLAALTAILWRLALLALVALPVVVAGLLQSGLDAGPGDGPGDGPLWAVWVLQAALTIVLTYRSTVWYLGIVWTLDRSREVAARLAVAEERLRFARDLHDVLGRNLTLIAVSSDLAAQLLQRGQDGAAEHVLAVHRTAQESVRELREVVGGYRTADLGTELAGARSVLRSAGIQVRVTGDAEAGHGARLSAETQVALGWAVREAVTNIIRHSRARQARIDLDVTSAPDPFVALCIENDGVPAAAPAPAPDGPQGAGLPGLRERLAGRRHARGWASARQPVPGRGQAPADRPARSGAVSGPASRCRYRCRRDGPGIMISILLADDENLIRSALAVLLGLEDDLRVVAQAASGDEALAMARHHRPDVAVLDLQMPGLDGIAVAGVLRSEVPGCATVIVTSHGRPGHLKRALAAGVHGFLPKTAPAHVLADVVRTAHRGGRYLDPDLAAEAISAGESPLTPREADVLELAASGAPVEEIARRAALAPGTVRNYLSSAAVKLGAANRHEAVHVARTHGWI